MSETEGKYTGKELEVRAVASAWVMLNNGNPILANFMVRDLLITQQAGMTEMCWLIDNNGTTSKGEVQWILSEIGSHLEKSTGEWRDLEVEGLARRVSMIDDLLDEGDPTDGVRDAIQEERDRLMSRIEEVIGD
jgi:hypothetical protein